MQRDGTANDPEDQTRSPSGLDFPVVGIGASAGGLSALVRFFKHMPSDAGMAFVVILHLSPKHSSNLHGLLQQTTSMPVDQVLERTRIEPDHVYVIPPTQQLAMEDGALSVADLDRPPGRHVAIDLFFRSLAAVHRERAFAIVLSGTGSDGAVGIARVKEQGGVTLAQDPQDAEFEGMPRAAIATQTIDFVLPVAEMPAKLVALWRNAQQIELPLPVDGAMQVHQPPSEEAVQSAEEALREIMQMLRVRTGHDFRHYKRATVLRRLERRLQVNALPNLPAYRAYFATQPDEAQALLRDLLIGVTHFFRDREAFDALDRQALTELFRSAEGGRDTVRAWVAGCATGEEAYSVAILLLEHAQAATVPPTVQVFASDIDERAIATARLATYPASIAADVSPARLRQFFSKDDERYHIRKEVRERLLFAVHNLLRDPPFSKLDLVCCRNLLIYLDRTMHREVLEMFHFALRPGGVLFLGSSETADATTELFAPLDKKHRIYRSVAADRPARYVPPLPSGATPQQLSAAIGLQKERRGRAPFGELHQRLVEQYLPPSVLIDPDANIVHLSGDVGRFLRHASGDPSLHLPSLVQPELRLELRSAIFQVQQTGKSVEARRVRIERDGNASFVNMIVRPVSDQNTGFHLMLVLFDEVEDTMPGEARAAPEPGAADPMVAHLEEELRRTKEQLQLTIEHSETSTEELKASNEELQAINEELRSASEELETSKEELQSINEELITVNHELKMKVEETGKINDDLNNLIASTHIATVFIDRALAIKRYTPPAAAIFNIIPTDVGRPLLDLTHRLDYPELGNDAAETLETLALREREVSSSDGKWYLARIRPYRTVEDRIDGAVLTFVDVTARRLAEERMGRIAESTKGYAIITFDEAGLITSWNLGAERMFGYTEAEAVGQPAALIFTPEDRERGAPEDELRRAREDGSAEDDRWHQRKDGTRLFVSGIVNPLLPEGRLEGFVKIARDLTGTKRAAEEREARLLRASSEQAVALAAAQSRDEFLAVMSHELKNPLNLIQLNAELLARLPEARDLPGVQRAADTIRRTVAGQAKIIDDLLDLSRINTGKLALRLAAVDWNRVVANLVEAMADEARKKGVRLELLEAAEGEPPIVALADPVRVEQIVWNLLSNAVKFTPEGGTVTLRLAREEGFGLLEIRDTGRGIDAEFLPRVFEMFEQADIKAKHAGGLGIGLALVRQLAQMQGGRVAAESEGEGRGASFKVWLPLHEPDSAEAEVVGRVAGSALAGRSVLLVDDEADSVQALCELLRLEGLEVTLAHGGPEALAAVRGGARFDFVISDLAMPGMDGYQLLEALQREAPGLPVLALTGFGRPADRERALAAGFRTHLSKPVTLEAVVEALLEVVGDGER